MNTASTTAEYSDGLRSYMLGIYNYMMLGLLASAATAWFAVSTGFATYLISSPILFIVLLLAPFGLIFAMAGAAKMSTSTMAILYFLFTVLEGTTLSVVLLKYTGSSIVMTLVATSAVFAGLSLWGYTTKRDLSGWGTFLIGALVGLIALMILNLFMQSTLLHLAIGAAGVLLFAGLIAYDTQKLKDAYNTRAFIGNSMQKAMIWGALDLYLDFLNMFLFLLRFLGVSNND